MTYDMLVQVYNININSRTSGPGSHLHVAGSSTPSPHRVPLQNSLLKSNNINTALVWNERVSIFDHTRQEQAFML